MSATATQMSHLAWRSLVRTLRQPAFVVTPFFFPLVLLSINAAGLHPATHLPGFPTDSFLTFALAVPFVHGALFAAINTGTDLARDIQTGFLSRLSLTPLRRVSLLAGYLGGLVALGVLMGATYLVLRVALGVHIAAGVPGVLVILLLAALIALAFGSLGAFLALRTGSGEAVQGLFPLLFMGLLISSMNLPRNLIGASWFRDLATANPVSYLIEGVRSLVVEGWNAEALALAFAAGAGVALFGLLASSAALRTRMTRT
jgi:ABC-2 type transport system permease protein